jgi:hypothetical protein
VVSAVPARAQDVGIGLRAGVSVTDLSFETDADSRLFGRRAGAAGGGFFTLTWSRWLALQPEVLYARKAAARDESGIETRVWIDYVEVPVLWRVRAAAAGPAQLHVLAGPFIGARLQARSRIEAGDFREEIDLSSDIAFWDAGVAAGAELDWGAVVIDGRLTWGLRDIDGDRTDDVSVRTRAVTVSGGLRF